MQMEDCMWKCPKCGDIIQMKIDLCPCCHYKRSMELRCPMIECRNKIGSDLYCRDCLMVYPSVEYVTQIPKEVIIEKKVLIKLPPTFICGLSGGLCRCYNQYSSKDDCMARTPNEKWWKMRLILDHPLNEEEWIWAIRRGKSDIFEQEGVSGSEVWGKIKDVDGNTILHQCVLYGKVDLIGKIATINPLSVYDMQYTKNNFSTLPCFLSPPYDGSENVNITVLVSRRDASMLAYDIVKSQHLIPYIKDCLSITNIIIDIQKIILSYIIHT